MLLKIKKLKKQLFWHIFCIENYQIIYYKLHIIMIRI